MLSKISKYRLVLVLLILAGMSFAILRSASTIATADGGTTTVIVEFRDEPAAVYKAKSEKSGAAVSDEALQNYRGGLRARQDQFLQALAASGVSYTVKSHDIKNYDGSSAGNVQLRYTLVYNGIALNVPNSSIAAIESMPEVKQVHPNEMLYTMLSTSVPYIQAPQVYGKAAELTQFDDLREGYEGQGINISVIDTGIDWTHPMFGGDPVPPRLGVAPVTTAVNTNKKVIYYLPLTDIGIEDGFGHGTHVGSTAAGYLAQAPGADGLPGTADDVRLHGVAPQAKLMSYKVCSDIRSLPGSLGLPSVGGCESADTIMALEDSVSPFTVTLQPKPVAHVINMSLGGAGGPNNPTAIAASNAALAGATVVASSGNSGPNDGTTGSPAAGTHVISVAANTHPGGDAVGSVDVLQASAINPSVTGAVTPAKSLPAASGFNRSKIYPMAGAPSIPAGSLAQRYVLVNNPTTTWPASVRGRIALVKKVTAPTFAYVSNMAAQSGAVGVIFMSATQNPTAVKGTIPSANISPADGEILVDAISSTDDNSIDPPSGAVSELPIRMNKAFSDKFMGEMANFSSRGPVRGLGQIKPDISAPGVKVLAAVPPGSVLGALAAVASPTSPNYYALDGTSMSSPHAAGAVALIKQAHLD
nr:S8 family serine peptidase [Acidobacteriota bacterium]